MGKPSFHKAFESWDSFKLEIQKVDLLGKYGTPSYYYEKKRERENLAEEGNRQQDLERKRLMAAEAAARASAETEYGARFSSLSEQRGRDISSMTERLSDWGFLPTDIAWKTGVDTIKSTYETKLKQLGSDSFFSDITNRKMGFE